MVYYFSSPEHEGPRRDSMFSDPLAEKITDEYIETLRNIKHNPSLTEQERNEGVADAFLKFHEDKEASGCTGLQLDSAWYRHIDDDGNVVF